MKLPYSSDRFFFNAYSMYMCVCMPTYPQSLFCNYVVKNLSSRTVLHCMMYMCVCMCVYVCVCVCMCVHVCVCVCVCVCVSYIRKLRRFAGETITYAHVHVKS